ncbi:hypothetical protein N007_02955 [Alicyclobacillus acidoterrestris ATCC 49025]|nr:hypothetical protein N007_02955 [Alicyclobacillus acidoterrestris ATCC 49025]
MPLYRRPKLDARIAIHDSFPTSRDWFKGKFNLFKDYQMHVTYVNQCFSNALAYEAD